VCVCAIDIQETHQEMTYPNVTSLYFATPPAFNAPRMMYVKFCTESDDGLARVQNGEEILPKVSTPE